jgi:hypothetical protein
MGGVKCTKDNIRNINGIGKGMLDRADIERKLLKDEKIINEEMNEEQDLSKGCCNECGYKADYIIDNNNYEDNGYTDLEQVPTDKMLCGVCCDEEQD